jgi:hypothetical protein
MAVRLSAPQANDECHGRQELKAVRSPADDFFAAFYREVFSGTLFVPQPLLPTAGGWSISAGLPYPMAE